MPSRSGNRSSTRRSLASSSLGSSGARQSPLPPAPSLPSATTDRYPEAGLTVLYEGRKLKPGGRTYGLTRISNDQDVLRSLAALLPADLRTST
jgi:hypothetical protein